MRLEVEIAFNLANSAIINMNQVGDSTENNVSNKQAITTATNNYIGYRGFQFAEDKVPAIADGSYRYFADTGYQGYMSATLSNSDGSFDIPVQLQAEVSNEIPQFLFFQFDKIINLYAIKFTISNNINANVLTIDNNHSATLLVDLSSLNLSTAPVILTITFYQVNKPYQSLRLTKLAFEYIVLYNGNTLKSCENSENLFDSQMTVSTGIIEQYASIVIYDRDKLLHTLAENEKLSEELNVTIRVINDEDNSIQDIGKYITESWDVDSNSSEVTLQCIDNIEQLDALYISAGGLQNRTIHDMLTTAFEAAGNLTWQYQDTETETYCKSISTPNSWWIRSTVKEFLQKICELGQLRIYTYLQIFTVTRCY